MDVWMAHSRRDNRCHHCPERIELLSPCVVTRSRRKTDRGVFTRVRRYHPQCWINQGLAYLEKHPTVLNLGRPRLQLTPEQRRRRQQLLTRHGQLMFYARNALDAQRYETYLTNINKAMALNAEMAGVGGVPRNWMGAEEFSVEVEP